MAAWMPSPMPGASSTTVVSASAGDLHLALPDADGLDRGSRRSRRRRAPAAPAASSRPARRGGRARPSTGCRRRGRARGPASAPGRRAARRRRTARTGRPPARRPACRPAQLGHQRAGRGGLADAGRAGDAHDLGVAGVRRQRGHHLAQQRRLVLDQRDQPRDRAGVALRARAGSDEVRDRRPSPSPAPALPASAQALRRELARSGRRPGRRHRTARRRRCRRRGA